MDKILQYLKKHGECSDKEIAEGIWYITNMIFSATFVVIQIQ